MMHYYCYEISWAYDYPFEDPSPHKKPIEIVPMKVYEAPAQLSEVTAIASSATATVNAPVTADPLTKPANDTQETPPVEYYNIIDENIIPEDPKSNIENLKLIQQILEDLKDFLENHKKQQQNKHEPVTVKEKHVACETPLKTVVVSRPDRDFERKYNQEFNRKLDHSIIHISDNEYGI